MSEENWHEVVDGYGRVRCAHPIDDRRLGRLVQVDGRQVIKWQCGRCEYILSGSLAKRLHPGWIDYPLLRDNRVEYPRPPCERCFSTEGTQWHHWAPRALFDDADDWPGSYLCPECHGKWHRIVTPDLARMGSFEGIL